METAGQSIEITPRIESLLADVPESARSEVLKRAWDICCDGAALAATDPEMEFDPWDGRHEKERIWIEAFCVSAVIDMGDFGAQNENAN